MNFAQVLKALRKEKRVTQQELSDILNLSGRSSICHYEAGKGQPSLEGLCALADYFGVTIDQLLGRAPLQDEGKEEKATTKIEAQRVEECLIQFVERVSKGGATTETEVQVLPAVAQLLINLQEMQMNLRFDLDNSLTIPHLQQFLKEECKRDHSHT